MVSKCMTSNQKVTEADLLCKSYQDDFRVAEEKLRTLKAVGEDLVTEHSKLELELGDRKSSTNENLVDPFYHLADFLTFLNLHYF